MTWVIAAHEWRRLRTGLLYWLVLAFIQALVAWLGFAQLEAFAKLAPQLKAGGSQLGVMDLVLTPSLNSLSLLLMLCIPLFAMGSLAGEVRSGRISLWLAAPVSTQQIVFGKLLGLWLASLPALLTALLTLGALGLGIDMEPGVFLLAAMGLAVFSLWLCCITLMLSGLFQHPTSALAASYALLCFLWLLDTLVAADTAWHHWALLPHISPWLSGLLRGEDLVYFASTALSALLVTLFLLARRRGET